MSASKKEDMKDERVPGCLHWSCEDVANWIEQLGFSHYKDCFLSNAIDGRRLILVDASDLPKIGITDFEDIKTIAKEIREQLHLDGPFWNRSVSLPPRGDLGMYLERKSMTGENSAALSYGIFLQDNEDLKWRPPLSNHCLLLPHD